MWLFGRHDTAVLMVCSANICRSPMAQGMLNLELKQRGLQRKIRVDSAGTHASQRGRAADPRAQKIGKREGINLRKCRSRQVVERDFTRFDYILAMDQRTYAWLLEKCPEDYRERISLLGEWAGAADLSEIPDPYYGNMAGFEMVFELLHRSIQGFIETITG
jgi:low molecular weight protein-tyrosine phosphatase